MSSQPDVGLTESSAARPRAIWTWLLLLAALLLAGLECWRPLAHQATEPAINPLDAAGAVSLADFANRETLRWHSVPRGTQVCDGVTFFCNGAIRIAGLRAARDGKHYPGAVLGVPVNKRGSRLHLLQAAENADQMQEGLPYARLDLHYTNGQSRRFDLLFGIHGEDWLQTRSESEPVADPNSRIAWSQHRSGDAMPVRLYHTTFENPLPDVTISTIDFISPLSEANLLLFGLTLADTPRTLASSYGPGETLGDPPLRDVITFTLQAETSQPLPVAQLAWNAQGPRVQIQFPPFLPDPQGQIQIEVPRRVIRTISYTATGPNGSSASGELKADPSGAFPKTFLIKLAPQKKP